MKIHANALTSFYAQNYHFSKASRIEKKSISSPLAISESAAPSLTVKTKKKFVLLLTVFSQPLRVTKIWLICVLLFFWAPHGHISLKVAEKNSSELNVSHPPTLPVFLSICYSLSVRQTVSLSVRHSVRLSIFLSVYLSVFFSISLSLSAPCLRDRRELVAISADNMLSCHPSVVHSASWLADL